MDTCSSEAPDFRRTQYEDGTHASRCIHCFRTIALNAESTEELDQLERRHICPEKALAQLRSLGIVSQSRTDNG